MTRPRLPLLLAMAALTLGIPADAPAQPVDPQAIVAQHYPFSRLSPEDVADRRSCYQVAATSPSGDPLRIVVGYTDTVDGVLQILDRDPQGNYQIFYESPSNLGMDGGITCDVSLVDVDGDGTLDAMLEMNFAKWSIGWLFRLGATGVTNLTALEHERRRMFSRLLTPGVVDLYHDGTLQVVTVGGVPEEDGGRVTQLPVVYKYSSGAIVVDFEALLLDHFKAGQPAVLRFSKFWLLEAGTGPYVLHITNGIRGGQKRATGLSIKINGVVLQGAARLTGRVEFLDIPLTQELLDENTIEVVPSGAAGAEVTVVIRKRPS